MLTTSQHIENMNYYNDSRTQGPARESFTVCVDDVEVELPTRWEVCPVCDGAGKHVNPSIDCGGLTREDFEDEDFIEDYRSGVYDVTCSQCRGRTTVRVVDEGRLSPDLLVAYQEQQKEEAEFRAMQRSELAFGC